MRALVTAVGLVVVLGATAVGSGGAVRADTPVATDVPVYAYYYIWFNTSSSWDRAKTDYPALGRYSSDDPAIMRQHVRSAKAAGIDGFTVSWKHTDALDSRLAALVQVAREEDFKLAIIYQGLDFTREPLPVERVEQDLAWFVATYAGDPVFRPAGGARPIVVWSGTWEFTNDEIARVSASLGEAVSLLASERNTGRYDAIAPLIDGNAYYWSSVNPDTYPDYPGKLVAMGESVHAHGGLWIAPAAPGFDARLVGGTTIVERNDGETLRRQVEAALASSPDVLGIISWNEFSENSHIEPSLAYGDRYLDVLAGLLGSPPTDAGDSSATPTTSPPVDRASPVRLIAASVVILVAGLVLLRARRSSSGGRDRHPPSGGLSA